MATVTITVCDTCAAQEGVTTYTVEAGGRIGVADLCAKHAAPLVAFLDAHTVAPHAVPGTRGSYRHTGRYRSTISTMEEIEASKVAAVAN